jgi:hypothetical protein
MAPPSLTDALEGLARPTDRAPEVTQIIGGAFEGAFGAVDAIDLTALATQHRAGYVVTLDNNAVRVRFDASAGWETPVPFAGQYWPTDVVSALKQGGVTATELGRRAAGATRVVRFVGGGPVDGGLINRIMATPHVIDVRFKPNQFDVLLAREAPTLGGLAHLVATRKIYRRRRLKFTPAHAEAAFAQLAQRQQAQPIDRPLLPQAFE